MTTGDLKSDAEHVASVLLDLIETHGVPGVDELIEELLSDSEMPRVAGCLMHLAHWLEIKIRGGNNAD